MNRNETVVGQEVSPAETDRRLAEYRSEGFRQRAIPHIIYHGDQLLCPWPGCGYRIAGIDFQLEKLNDPGLYIQLLAAWWQGQGLAGRCPGCGQFVFFGMLGKRAVQDPAAEGLVVLPDDWHKNAYIM
jgi:hypothetical protein